MSVSVFTAGAGRGAASGVTIQNVGTHTVGSGFATGSGVCACVFTRAYQRSFGLHGRHHERTALGGDDSP